jgi:hypothetical protein
MPGGTRSLAHVGYDEMNEARNLIYDLKRSLELLHHRDPDQEIWSRSYETIDKALRLAAEQIGDHPVVGAIRELYSPESVAEGREVRVADLLPDIFMLDGILNRRVSEMAFDEPGAVRRRRATGRESSQDD